MTTIADQFQQLISGVFPNGRGGCDLTHKKRKQFERVFFLGWRACLTKTMTQPTEEAAAESYEAQISELNEYFKDVAVAVEEKMDGGDN